MKRVDREADGAPLLREWPERVQGFESLTLCQYGLLALLASAVGADSSHIVKIGDPDRKIDLKIAMQLAERLVTSVRFRYNPPKIKLNQKEKT